MVLITRFSRGRLPFESNKKSPVFGTGLILDAKEQMKGLYRVHEFALHPVTAMG
jgi:hypothetical protein